MAATSQLQSWSFSFFMLMANILLMISCKLTSAVFQPSLWQLAHATFYGDETASETMELSEINMQMLMFHLCMGHVQEERVDMETCYANGYGTDTAALSSILFNNGYACGSCYQIKCFQSPWCFTGDVAFTTVTATNLCPPNWSQDSNAGGWCNPPRTHFDLSKPAFMKIAQWKAGIIPIMYRRVPCARRDGLRFSFQGNGYWLLVYVMNVGGGGDISQMWVKGSKTGWISMSHNWGASYQAFATLGGQSLSFMITSYTTKETIYAWDVAPSNWNQGLTYKANINFR